MNSAIQLVSQVRPPSEENALTECYRGPESRSGLILGFGGADEGLIDGAVRTLAEVIRDVM